MLCLTFGAFYANPKYESIGRRHWLGAVAVFRFTEQPCQRAVCLTRRFEQQDYGSLGLVPVRQTPLFCLADFIVRRAGGVCSNRATYLIKRWKTSINAGVNLCAAMMTHRPAIHSW